MTVKHLTYIKQKRLQNMKHKHGTETHIFKLNINLSFIGVGSMIMIIYNGQNCWKSNKTSGSLRQIGFKFNPDCNLDSLMKNFGAYLAANVD